jgi:hypothetical protein
MDAIPPRVAGPGNMRRFDAPVASCFSSSCPMHFWLCFGDKMIIKVDGSWPYKAKAVNPS